jgi:Vps53-like, N-terminal
MTTPTHRNSIVSIGNAHADEVLDNPDFNVIECINTLFPTGPSTNPTYNPLEQSLVSLDTVLSTLEQNVKILNKEISDQVKKQGTSASQQTRELDILRASVLSLQAKIKGIKEKAVLIVSECFV